MRSQNGDAPRTPTEFKYEGQMYLLLAWLAITGLWLFMGFAIETSRSIRQEPVSSGEVFFFGSLLIILFIGVFPLLGRSDIVINDQSISRRLFGKTWQTIRWDNILVIRTFLFFHPALKKTVRGFNIYPALRPRFSLSPISKMAFSDQAVNISELIEIMNHYVTKHKIKIETTDNGVTTVVTRL